MGSHSSVTMTAKARGGFFMLSVIVVLFLHFPLPSESRPSEKSGTEWPSHFDRAILKWKGLKIPVVAPKNLNVLIEAGPKGISVNRDRPGLKPDWKNDVLLDKKSGLKVPIRINTAAFQNINWNIRENPIMILIGEEQTKLEKATTSGGTTFRVQGPGIGVLKQAGDYTLPAQPGQQPRPPGPIATFSDYQAGDYFFPGSVPVRGNDYQMLNNPEESLARQPAAESLNRQADESSQLLPIYNIG